MRDQSTDTVDKAVCTEESGAARLEAVLVALVERKARALHAEHSRTHPLLLLLRHLPDEEGSIIGSPGEELPAHWCEHEIARHKRKKLKLQTHRSKEQHGTDQLELERRKKRRRRRSPHGHGQKPKKHRTLLVSAIDEQAKVIHVLDPDELPRRARYTIMVTACLLLFLCLLLVGVTLRMAPLIDDMGRCNHNSSSPSVSGLSSSAAVSGSHSNHFLKPDELFYFSCSDHLLGPRDLYICEDDHFLQILVLAIDNVAEIAKDMSLAYRGKTIFNDEFFQYSCNFTERGPWYPVHTSYVDKINKMINVLTKKSKKMTPNKFSRSHVLSKIAAGILFWH